MHDVGSFELIASNGSSLLIRYATETPRVKWIRFETRENYSRDRPLGLDDGTIGSGFCFERALDGDNRLNAVDRKSLAKLKRQRERGREREREWCTAITGERDLVGNATISTPRLTRLFPSFPRCASAPFARTDLRKTQPSFRVQEKTRSWLEDRCGSRVVPFLDIDSPRRYDATTPRRVAV